jgi:hypothetical protein
MLIEYIRPTWANLMVGTYIQDPEKTADLSRS